MIDNEDPKVIASLFNSIIKYYGNIKDKNVLDVGCYTGYYTFLMAQHGANVTGVEAKLEWAAEAEKQRISKKISVNIVYATIQDFIKNNQSQFDIVLMLNVFHYILHKNRAEAWQILKTISERTKCMFMMLKIKKGDLAQKFLKEHKQFFPSLPEDLIFAEMVLKKTDFTHYEIVVLDSIYKKRDLWVFLKNHGHGEKYDSIRSRNI